ncbi:hypothetical protein SVAN01_03177 [Stagonosporopsis vannaccii]|nr:hypothetical protein SVAN01_03177 [Stagonosporopsis vannaccii]
MTMFTTVPSATPVALRHFCSGDLQFPNFHALMTSATFTNRLPLSDAVHAKFIKPAQNTMVLMARAIGRLFCSGETDRGWTKIANQGSSVQTSRPLYSSLSLHPDGTKRFRGRANFARNKPLPLPGAL